MGTCLGHCFSKIIDPFTYRYHGHTRMPSQEKEPVELCQLTDDEGSTAQSGTSKSLLSFLSLKRFKKKHGVPVTLELAEESCWSTGFNRYSRLKSINNASTSSGLNTPPQILDARTLMKHPGCISSTPVSSLDLEWEHEVMPLPVAFNSNETESTNGSSSHTSRNGSQPSSLTASPWSRVSSPNSLEWDPVEADIACVDVETEQLLTEIERLTVRTLKETGEWTGTR